MCKAGEVGVGGHLIVWSAEAGHVATVVVCWCVGVSEHLDGPFDAGEG